jgi:hypothetical protein
MARRKKHKLLGKIDNKRSSQFALRQKVQLTAKPRCCARGCIARVEQRESLCTKHREPGMTVQIAGDLVLVTSWHVERVSELASAVISSDSNRIENEVDGLLPTFAPRPGMDGTNLPACNEVLNGQEEKQKKNVGNNAGDDKIRTGELPNVSFDQILNRIERETEKKFPGYRGPNWGKWTPGRANILNNPSCTCNGSFDHTAREWHHHGSCPAFGDDSAWE